MSKKSSKSTTIGGKSGAIVLALPNALTIENARIFLAECRQACERVGATGQLTLDIAALHAITTPGMQLLIALQKTLGARLSVIGESPPLRAASAILGLGAWVDTYSSSPRSGSLAHEKNSGG